MADQKHPKSPSEPDITELSDWDPDALLEEIAASRGLTVGQLRARVRAVADAANARISHIEFEHARDCDFSDEELAHLQECSFCKRLVFTLTPTDDAVAAFERLVDQRIERSSGIVVSLPLASAISAGVRRQWIPLAAAAGIAFVAVGSWFAMRPSLQNSSVVAKSPIEARGIRACTEARQTSEGCELLARAANYEVQGEPRLANAFVLAGLAETGVKDEALRQITVAFDPASPIPTERMGDTSRQPSPASVAALTVAQAEFKAGRSLAGYQQVVSYLRKEDSAASASALETGFVQPVRYSYELAGMPDSTAEARPDWLAEVSIGSDANIASGGLAEQPDRTFIAGHSVHLVTDIQGAPASTPVRVLWFGPDGQKISEEVIWTDRDGKRLGFTAVDTSAWTSGEYRAELWIADHKVKQEPFEIVQPEVAAHDDH